MDQHEAQLIKAGLASGDPVEGINFIGPGAQFEWDGEGPFTIVALVLRAYEEETGIHVLYEREGFEGVGEIDIRGFNEQVVEGRIAIQGW